MDNITYAMLKFRNHFYLQSEAGEPQNIRKPEEYDDTLNPFVWYLRNGLVNLIVIVT